MEPSWGHQGFYQYYQQDPNRPSDRSPTSPSHEGPNPDGQSHRRSVTQPSFLPPPPPPHTASASSHNMNLPPFSSAFYTSHYSTQGGHQAGTSGPGGMHLPHNIGYPSPHLPMSVSGPQPYHTSPVTMSAPPFPSHRQPPPHNYAESPRLPTAYSSSPGIRHLSPTSPTTHLAPPGMSASVGSTSSSSFPSATRTNSGLPKGKRRSGSASQSAESWDEGEGRYMGISTKEERDLDEGDEEGGQPWGMPQDEYKALNPRDKKQVRNRIGARRFRAKRKDYVSSLEGNLRSRDNEIQSLRSQVESHRLEINELRTRLGIPLLSPPGADTSGLGLLGARPSVDDWDTPEEDRKDG